MVNNKITKSSNNMDAETVASFGDEWSRYDQSSMSYSEASEIFMAYFSIFPWDMLPSNPVGFDMGCGSGRWAKFVAPKVGRLNCIDPSSALDIARRNLIDFKNVEYIKASVSESGIPINSQDFGYSLGVLHHVPDTESAINSCVSILKSGAPLLVYLYYAFDNRGWVYRLLWRASDLVRRIICKLPSRFKHLVTDVIAAIVYFPLARLSLLLDKVGINAASMPLFYYRNHSFYTMRTDSRDRFGTPLEQRFTKQQIKSYMERSGLIDIKFSDNAPYWCAVGIKK
ncbi:MAG: class I SAM-dependent methyltransferase [Gammaproteobacteria bacterium]|nr:class I SAM-dependent methyltransferase [Gammaproteobacteria bacterium]